MVLSDKSTLLYTYRDLRAKKHLDEKGLFALEKPADWSYKPIDALIGYIINITSEQNRVARSQLLLTDKKHTSKLKRIFLQKDGFKSN